MFRILDASFRSFRQPHHGTPLGPSSHDSVMHARGVFWTADAVLGASILVTDIRACGRMRLSDDRAAFLVIPARSPPDFSGTVRSNEGRLFVAPIQTPAEDAMESVFRQDSTINRGAVNITNDIRQQLIKRGRSPEEITLAWFPDPQLVALPEAPELKAMIADNAAVRQMFSREELEVSSERLERDSVIAKINLVVESLHAGLP
jgi:hypothetical protein